jgi:ADP-ribose pyrophosphatase
MTKIVPEDSVLVPDGAKRVFSGMIYDVYQWPQKMFDGSSRTFEMLKRPDTVTVICVVDDKVLIVDDEQPYRGLRETFPGGRVDKGDTSIEAAARREVLEETGYSFKNWRLVKVWQPHNKIEWFVHVLLAWELAGKQDPNPDIGEKITLRNLSFDELKSLAANKSGYPGGSTAIVEEVENLQQLLALPEFTGQTVDR